MPNSYFQFKQFRIEQGRSGMKVTTDGCLFGGWVANEVQRADEPTRILDIGAGTGLLSLMLAQVTKESQIDAIEINKNAYQEATQNFKDSKWSDRLFCYQTSIQDFQADQKYNLIICNPPFFKDSQEGDNVNKNQALHSSSLDATDLLNHIIRLLDSNGCCYLLYPEREMKAFKRMALTKGLFPARQMIVRNQKDHPVFRVMTHFSLLEKKETTSELNIRNADRKYTKESWELLKDYYLAYNSPI
ncbi:methyltransferase [Ekhidna sp.]|uniref:tRNA1(Val) (adenine(37)-N6)-methyltransferase n=1 Tax=Ekhidna sp. TaxID=2608089 RepID=UPI0032EDFEB4